MVMMVVMMMMMMMMMVVVMMVMFLKLNFLKKPSERKERGENRTRLRA